MFYFSKDPAIKFTFGLHESNYKPKIWNQMRSTLKGGMTTLGSKFDCSEPPDRFNYKNLSLFVFVIYFSE
jgi:hypothetical protein